jgi:hypothetical protein
MEISTHGANPGDEAKPTPVSALQQIVKSIHRGLFSVAISLFIMTPMIKIDYGYAVK